MEVQTTESSASTSTGSSTASSTADVSQSSQPTSNAASEASQSATSASTAGGTEETAQYQPDYKFKAANKEHEIDDFLRPAITSKEHEQKLKEIYEKAYGIDEVKQGREKVREELKTYKAQVEPVLQPVMQAAQMYQGAQKAFQEGNVRGAVFKAEEAFKQLGISDKFLQQYVFQKLKLEELPPELKQDYNRQRELETQFAQMQTQVHEWQSQAQNMAVAQRQSDLKQATSKPDVASIVQAYDQRNGQGAFETEVILRGQQYWQLRQQDVPADQLVSEIITKFGLQAPQTQQAPPQATNRDVPVIPVVKGATGSPAAKGFKSLEDIKAYRKQQFGS